MFYFAPQGHWLLIEWFCKWKPNFYDHALIMLMCEEGMAAINRCVVDSVIPINMYDSNKGEGEAGGGRLDEDDCSGTRRDQELFGLQTKQGNNHRRPSDR